MMAEKASRQCAPSVTQIWPFEFPFAPRFGLLQPSRAKNPLDSFQSLALRAAYFRPRGHVLIG
jgi:hypothetical protein